MRIKINLFRKIFIFSIFLIIFTVGLSYTLSVFVSDSFYIARKKEEIRELVPTIKKLMFDERIFEDYIDDIKNTQGIDVYLSDNSYYDSFYGIEYDNNYDDIEDGFHVNNIGKTHIMLLVYKEKISDEKTLFMSTSLSVMSSHRHEVYFLNLITLVLSLILSIIISRLFAKKITKNIFELNRVAKKITNLDFSEKALVDTSDELLELSENINTMSNSLSTSINNLKSFVSNASHELKTPITVINSHAQILLKNSNSSEEERKKYYRAILKESNSMNSLVQDLLLLSKLSALDLKFDTRLESFNSMLEESIEKYEFLELEKDIQWDIKVDNLNLLVNRKFFQIALNNIIQNALKYSPNRSTIKIYQDKNRIIFENPTSITETQSSETLLQPFARGDNANELKIDGHGLGLSLIKKILELHNLSFSIEIKDNRFIFSLTYSGHNL
jgi:two-component system sensor histidine kinase VanS